MGDLKLQLSPEPVAVTPGIYSVYIDQDDKPDGFTVRNGESESVDRNDSSKGNSSFSKCLPEFTGLKFEPSLSLGKYWGNLERNLFELASGRPLNESVFKNADGEELRVGSVVNRKSDTDGFNRWKILGFKIAGFTDDPERKRTANMSRLPNEKRKYAVIHAVVAPISPADGETTSSYTEEVPLDGLSTKSHVSLDELDRATPPVKERGCKNLGNSLLLCGDELIYEVKF